MVTEQELLDLYAAAVRRTIEADEKLKEARREYADAAEREKRALSNFCTYKESKQ